MSTEGIFFVNDYVWFDDADETRSQVRGQIGIIRSITHGKTARVEFQGLDQILELPVTGLRHHTRVQAIVPIDYITMTLKIEA